MFVYEAYKPGGERFLNQLLELLGKSKALIAGGIVESVFSPPKTWQVHVASPQLLLDPNMMRNYTVNTRARPYDDYG